MSACLGRMLRASTPTGARCMASWVQQALGASLAWHSVAACTGTHQSPYNSIKGFCDKAQAYKGAESLLQQGQDKRHLLWGVPSHSVSLWNV